MKVERHYEDFQKPNKIEEGGVIRLSGSFLLDHEAEVLGLVRHEGGDKVMNLEKVDGVIVATIADHNVALHIGKSLEHAYKGKHEFKFLKGEKYVEVLWRRDD